MNHNKLQPFIQGLSGMIPGTVGGYAGFIVSFFLAQPLWVQLTMTIAPPLVMGLIQLCITITKGIFELRKLDKEIELEEHKRLVGRE
jgi:hypothetical protein